MPTTIEHIAVEALREIAKRDEFARKALDQIEDLQKPTVHHLSAADVVIDKPPGGGL